MRDILLKAANIIEEHTWWDGKSPNRLGERRTCIALALFEAGGWSEAHRLVAGHLGLDLSNSVFGELYRWNDTPGRTKEQVVAVLREVAEKAQSYEKVLV